MRPELRYGPPPAGGGWAAELVLRRGTPEEVRCPFLDTIEIGRAEDGGEIPPGTVWIADPTVSSRHCVITRTADRRFVVRDLSRNGTRLDGRRLLPGLEVEFRPGQVLSFGAAEEASICPREAIPECHRETPRGTLVASGTGLVSVLVGDIKDYTGLVRLVPPEVLQRSVCRVFEGLETVLAAHGGSLKEYQGDAVCAYWEDRGETPAPVRACEAALALERAARDLGGNPGVWEPEPPLRMDWAVATGTVTVGVLGGDRPSGLSMVGRPILLAYRLEKLADDATGSILVCPRTYEAARNRFRLRPLGLRHPPGFEESIEVYSLSEGGR